MARRDRGSVNRLFGRDLIGVRIIGAGKLLSGLVSLVLAAAVFGHLDFDVAGWVTHTSELLHLAPGNRVLRKTIEAASGVHEGHLRVLGIVAFIYAILHLVEGVGLILERRWAGRLTVFVSGAFIPLEAFEIARRFTPVRIAVIMTNVAIVIYVAIKLRRAEEAWVSPESPDCGKVPPGPRCQP